MTLSRVTVREFRASFAKLAEPTLVGDGIWFPRSNDHLERIGLAIRDGTALFLEGSGDAERKGPPGSGEPAPKGPSPEERPRGVSQPEPPPDNRLVKVPLDVQRDRVRATIRAQQKARDAILAAARGKGRAT